MICAKCNDTGWVCEYHPDKEAHECCGGAGMPCTCNTANPPWNFEPPTVDDLIARFERAVVERERGVSRDSEAMEDQINARRDALLAAINATGKCIYPNCNTGSDPSAKPRSGFSPSTAGE